MEVTYPKWLDKDFIEKALKSEGESSVKVVSYNVTNATASGDNYMSDMYRVTVHVTRGSRAEVTSIIVKCSREPENLTQTLRERNVFDREIYTFTLILPSLHRLLSNISLANYQPISPNLLYTVSGLPQHVIVLEDLKAQDFKMAERTLRLDLKHSLLVMKQIGRYHAASAVLQETTPDHLQCFHESLYGSKGFDTSEHFFRSGVTNLATEVRKWPQYEERFSEKLMNLADNAYTRYVGSLKRDEEEFNVLCHGDLWLNNMMFRYSKETGEVTDIRFVDYQLGYWTSPAIDLQYFFHSSLSPDLLDKLHILVEEYYKSLTETLSALGYRGLQPTLEQLQTQLQRRGLYTVLTCCAILPVFLVDRRKAPDAKKLLKNEADVHLSEGYKETMKKFLPIFEKKGWL